MSKPPKLPAKVYLSRKNLLTLLSKLDRQLDGEITKCTIIKHRGIADEFQQSMETCIITAVENKEYYDSQNRAAGEMHPADEIKTHGDGNSY